MSVGIKFVSNIYILTAEKEKSFDKMSNVLLYFGKLIIQTVVNFKHIVLSHDKTLCLTC